MLSSSFSINHGQDKGPKQVEEFLNVVGIIFPIKHWWIVLFETDNQNNSGLLEESSFQWNIIL